MGSESAPLIGARGVLGFYFTYTCVTLMTEIIRSPGGKVALYHGRN